MTNPVAWREAKLTDPVGSLFLRRPNADLRSGRTTKLSTQGYSQASQFAEAISSGLAAIEASARYSPKRGPTDSLLKHMQHLAIMQDSAWIANKAKGVNVKRKMMPGVSLVKSVQLEG